MNKDMPTNRVNSLSMRLRNEWALLVIRTALLYPLFGIKARIWIFETAKKDDFFLNAVAFEMTKHGDVRYSRRILKILLGLPDDVLENNRLLKTLFARKELHAQNVKEGIAVCLAALTVCIRPK